MNDVHGYARIVNDVQEYFERRSHDFVNEAAWLTTANSRHLSRLVKFGSTCAAKAVERRQTRKDRRSHQSDPAALPRNADANERGTWWEIGFTARARR
jgi:hypothetical protein